MKRTNNFFRALSLLLCLLTLTGLFAACKIIISVPPAGTLAPPVADDAPATKTPSTTESTPTESTPGESATTETTSGESATTGKPRPTKLRPKCAERGRYRSA